MCYPVGEIGRDEYHPYSYHRPSPLREIQRLLESEGLEIEETRKIIFIWKSVPDFLFPFSRFLEIFFEKIPLLKDLASTLVVSARKR